MAQGAGASNGACRKDEVLGLYLTLAPFGGNLEGVRAASLAYFGKEPSRLSRGRGGVARRAAALAGAAAPRPASRGGARRARPRAARMAGTRGDLADRDSPRRAPRRFRGAGWRCRSTHRTWRGSCATSEPTALVHRTTIDPLLQRRVEALLQREVAALDPEATLAALVVDNRDRAGARLCRQRRFRLGGAARHARHGARRALAGIGAEALHLRDGLRPADHPSGDRARGPAAAFRRLRAEPISTGDFQGEVTPREALQYSLNVPAVAVLDRLGPGRFTGALAAAGIRLRLPPADGRARSGGGARRRRHHAGRSGDGSMRRCRMAARSRRCAIATRRSGDAAARRSSGRSPPGTSTTSWPRRRRRPASCRPRSGAAGRLAFKTGTSYGYPRCLGDRLRPGGDDRRSGPGGPTARRCRAAAAG